MSVRSCLICRARVARLHVVVGLLPQAALGRLVDGVPELDAAVDAANESLGMPPVLFAPAVTQPPWYFALLDQTAAQRADAIREACEHDVSALP